MPESLDHLISKWTIAWMFHQLGFKVEVEAALYIYGSEYVFDVIAIKNKAAIIIEVGELQYRDISFDELYASVRKYYSRFNVRHVIFSNPPKDQLDFRQITSDDIDWIQLEIEDRQVPDGTLNIRY
jgi:hypothetical protein